MDRVLLGALLLLCAPAGKGSGLSRAGRLGRGTFSPLQPDAAERASNSCSRLGCSPPGGALVDWPLFHAYEREAPKGTCSEAESDWSFYVLVAFVVAGSLGCLCLRPPIRQCLAFLCNRFRGVNRSHRRNSHCSHSRPRNYGTLMDMPLESPHPRNAEGPAKCKACQEEGDEDSKTEACDCGDESDFRASSEVTVEMEDVA